jgi:hypothetical protein
LHCNNLVSNYQLLTQTRHARGKHQSSSWSVFVNTCSTHTFLGPVMLLLLCTWTLAPLMYTSSTRRQLGLPCQHMITKPIFCKDILQLKYLWYLKTIIYDNLKYKSYLYMFVRCHLQFYHQNKPLYPYCEQAWKKSQTCEPSLKTFLTKVWTFCWYQTDIFGLFKFQCQAVSVKGKVAMTC